MTIEITDQNLARVLSDYNPDQVYRVLIQHGAAPNPSLAAAVRAIHTDNRLKTSLASSSPGDDVTVTLYDMAGDLENMGYQVTAMIPTELVVASQHEYLSNYAISRGYFANSYDGVTVISPDCHKCDGTGKVEVRGNPRSGWSTVSTFLCECRHKK